MKLTQITGPTLRRAETKRKKKFKLEALEKENSETMSKKKKKKRKERKKRKGQEILHKWRNKLEKQKSE